jgi:hypothetical protein
MMKFRTEALVERVYFHYGDADRVIRAAHNSVTGAQVEWYIAGR